MYYKKSEDDQHVVFCGIFCPFNNHHAEIITNKMKKFPKSPVLILVKDIPNSDINVIIRVKIIEEWMSYNKIDGQVIMIPSIQTGYFTMFDNIETCLNMARIREMVRNRDESWRDLIPAGTHEYMEKIIGSGIASNPVKSAIPAVNPFRIRGTL